VNLRTKFCIGALTLVVLVVAGVATMTIFSERQLLLEERENHHRQLVKQLAKVCEESLLQQDELILFNYFKTLKAERGFLEASFVDRKNMIRNHSDPVRIGSLFNSPLEKEVQNTKNVFAQRYTGPSEVEIRDFASPVDFGSKRAGVVRLLFDQSVINSFVKQSLKKTLQRVSFISLIALLIGLVGALWLSKTMVHPIRTVVTGMRDIADGHLEPLPESTSQDELGWMTRELNITINKLKELDEMKREFTAAVTHELRSPLTAIERFSSLLLKGSYGPLTTEQKESLMTVKNNTIRLSQFVDDLLTTAKLEAKRIDLFYEKFDMREVVQDIFKLYQPVAIEKGLALKIELPKGPIWLTSDKGKVSEILSNLVSNAHKFTPQGAVMILANETQKSVQVVVSDTGPGIPKEEQEKIFDKFYRGKWVKSL